MTQTFGPALQGATDDEIEHAVGFAEPMVLRGLLYQLTGDEQLKTIEITTVFTGFQRTKRVARKDDVATLRAKAIAFLKAQRDAGGGTPALGPPDRLAVSAGLTLGEDLEGDEISLCLEELALDPWARAHRWRARPSPERLGAFSVTIIGAGLGGLNAALMLKRAGIRYTILDKNPGVGGTWHENRYPGARVDTPSRGYTHIFGVNFPYPNPFCDWSDNQRYFDWVADTHGIRDDIEFSTEVRSLSWDETTAEWEIEIDGPEGRRTRRSQAVITAVGFLNRPRIPEIDGAADFRGQICHTARWPREMAVEGKRIAVIGTGCSGYQVAPELALDAAHVVLFQRTPSWVFGVPGYRSPFPPGVKWLDHNLPYHTNFMRLRTLGAGKAFSELTMIDRDFDDPHAVSELNREMRQSSIDFLESKLRDPSLVATMTPRHPPWSARPVIVDPDYSVLDAIQRDNMTLVCGGIRRVNATGLEAADGTQYDVDAIVYATGFHATDYLYPMQITGRRGRTLDEFWRVGGARAHRFCMVPGFPNLWSIYGPNTNGGIGPGAFHELVTRYILQCIEHLVLEDRRAIEPTEDAYWRHNHEVDRRNAGRVWSDPRAHNYYWTEHGRSATMCPFNGPELWRLLRTPMLDEFEVR